MDDARRAAAALLCALLFASAAGAQDSAAPPAGPIPYVQLKRAERARAQRTRAISAARARLARLRAGPVARPAPAPGASAARAAAPPSASSPPAPPSPAPPLRPPAPSPPRASAAPPIVAAAPPTGAPALPAPAPRPADPATAPAGPRLVHGPPLPQAEVEAFVDGEVSRSLADGRGAGAVVAVVQGGRTVLLKGYGWADVATRRPADPGRTLMRLGSASRLLTSTFVLKAVEAGRLRLDAPADAALPAPLRLPAEGYPRPIRLDEVLRQRAGLEARELGRLFTGPDRVLPLDEALRRDRPHRVRDPGVLPMENDYGVALAGAAAAHAEGAEFEAAIERELLAPAGLGSTSFREPRAAREGRPEPLDAQRTSRLAQGYAWTRRGIEPRAWGFAGGLGPALGAVTTAEDMARLMDVELAGGTPPGGPQAWSAVTAAALSRTDERDGRTLGRGVASLPGGFAGYGEVGAAPGFRARYLVAPALDLGVFVAVNSEASGGLVEGLAPDLVRRFYPAGDAAPPQTTPTAAGGRYLATRRAYHGLEGFADRLRGLLQVVQAGDGALILRGAGRNERLTAEGPDRFRAADGSEWRTAGAPSSPAALLIQPSRAASFERVGALYRPETLATVSGLAFVTAILVLLGPIGRAGRDSNRPTPAQTAAAAIQGVAALLWIVAIGCVACFLRRTADPDALMREWPDPWLVAGSGCGLAAAALSVAQVVQLPSAWAEGRRLAGWSAARKLRHTASVLVFAAMMGVTAAWGALEPWSG